MGIEFRAYHFWMDDFPGAGSRMDIESYIFSKLGLIRETVDSGFVGDFDDLYIFRTADPPLGGVLFAKDQSCYRTAVFFRGSGFVNYIQRVWCAGVLIF